nr:MAG TPA: hypothetical protein [Caudoviricetes sp.]
MIRFLFNCFLDCEKGFSVSQCITSRHYILCYIIP